MIKELKMYTMQCDNCGIDVFENMDYCGYSDVQSVIDEAIESEWEFKDGKQYCPECYYIDDDDNLVIIKKEETK